MFGDNPRTRELAEFLLEIYTLPQILEMNELTEEDALSLLLEHGYLSEPQTVIQEYEIEEDD